MTFTTRPELMGTFGMVSSTHWLASQAGMAALERGGNAFDAAVAAGLTLQVVEPHLNGPGGEVPILVYQAGTGRAQVIAGQGTAPAAATIERFRGLGLDLVPGTGLLAACVPGAFDAWMLLLRDFGRLRLGEVMEHAIGFAGGGFPVVARITDTIRNVEDLFRREWTTSAEVYLRGGAPAPGSLSTNEALARTYSRLVAEGEAVSSDRNAQIDAARDGFYRGFVAEEIDRFCKTTEARDSSGDRHAGLLSGDDMASYRARVEEPVEADHHGYRLCKPGPWTQGPVFLQQLALLAGFDLGTMERNGADHIHTVIECAKLAFADREAWYGDPDFVDVPLDDLLDPAYADERRALVSARASLELRPGTPGGRPPRLPQLPDAASLVGVRSGEPTGQLPSDGDTCQVDVVDVEGNMVAATPSGGWLQSSPVIPSLGFPLGTRAQMFWLTPGLPNSLEPGKRPRTTLTPSIALRDGEASMAFGTPGGDKQDQWSLNFFLNHAHWGLNLQEAIDAPTFHTDHFPASFFPRAARPGEVAVEARLDEGVIAELRRRGHRVTVEGPWSLGRLCAVARDGRVLKAAANPRGMQGYAVGR